MGGAAVEAGALRHRALSITAAAAPGPDAVGGREAHQERPARLSMAWPALSVPRGPWTRRILDSLALGRAYAMPTCHHVHNMLRHQRCRTS